MTKAFALILVLILGSGYSACSTVPESTRSEYASGMFDAFVSQSYGKSTVATYQFEISKEKAEKAGENPIKINAIANLMIWYRTYASSLGLYHCHPSGNDYIIGEYHPSSSRNPMGRGLHMNYQSEWGRNPEQARLMRDFMLGVGEVIAGVFCVSVGSPLFGTIGFGVGANGFYRIYDSLNFLWTNHQVELQALKEWEQGSLKPALNQ